MIGPQEKKNDVNFLLSHIDIFKMLRDSKNWKIEDENRFTEKMVCGSSGYSYFTGNGGIVCMRHSSRQYTQISFFVWPFIGILGFINTRKAKQRLRRAMEVD